MIAFDFAYYRPETVEEAVNQFKKLRSEGQTVMYYGGGTEFISRARRHEIHADVIIDLKGIPDCHTFQMEENELVIGSAVTLSKITDSNLFPLLANVSRSIATRTERNKITIGGNMMSHLMYREGLLPLLLTNAEVKIASDDGIKKMNVRQVFDQGIQLKEGEFIVQIQISKRFTQLPFYHRKKTKHSRINYPIISLAAVREENKLSIACSGACEHPFLFGADDKFSGDRNLSQTEKISRIVDTLPSPILSDMYATAGYRKFVLENELHKLLKQDLGVSND